MPEAPAVQTPRSAQEGDTGPRQRWQTLTSRQALLIEIPLALALLAAGLLAALPNAAWD
jgi:hypothetical protein